uniref:Minor capsid protein L2 n=1 Tax=Eidolon bat papillomavirus TaxID=3141875 RepID=A0AAU7E2N4_9PAPI
MAPHKRARRIPRDSAGNIYRNPGCSVFGNCPQDVKNKIENKTPADKILQYGSAVVNLGGLSIGTGSGRGGLGGYIPIGSGRGVGVGAWPVPAYPARPPVPAIETLGPEVLAPEVVLPTGPVAPEVTPELIELEPIIPGSDIIDATAPVDPEAPAVIDDMGTFPGRPAIIDESTPTQGGRQIEVVAEIHHPPDLFTVHPTAEGGGSTSAVLEVGESVPLMPRSFAPHLQDPAIHTASTSFGSRASISGGRFTQIDYDISGEFIGDDIPLLNRTYDPEENLVFRTSTPEAPARRGPAARLKALYHRFTQQVPIEDPLFMEAPGAFVEFGNPAFNPDDTIEFPIEGPNPLASPDTRLQGVHTLHRALLSEGPTGRVRVSRLGSIAAMKTRSGAIVGPRAHVFHDVSSIQEAIELQPLGRVPESVSGQNVVEDLDADVLTEVDDTAGGFEDVPLLDEHAGQSVRLGVSLGGNRNRNWVNLELPTTVREGFGVNIGTGRDIYVNYPSDTVGNEIGPGIPLGPTTPAVPGLPLTPGFAVEDDTYPYDYWDDVYVHWKKRRKYCTSCSFADVLVDA